MRVVEELTAWGHPSITGRHRSTFEVTKAGQVTRRGDCVIGVKSSKSAADLDPSFKKQAQREDAEITFVVEAGCLMESAVGRGSPKLTFTHEEDLVARKSDFTCCRTLMIRSDKAAQDFSRSLIRILKNPQLKLELTVIAEV